MSILVKGRWARENRVDYQLANSQLRIHRNGFPQSLFNDLVGGKERIDVADQSLKAGSITLRTFLLTDGLNPAVVLVSYDADCLAAEGTELPELLGEQHCPQIRDIPAPRFGPTDEIR